MTTNMHTTTQPTAPAEIEALAALLLHDDETQGRDEASLALEALSPDELDRLSGAADELSHLALRMARASRG